MHTKGGEQFSLVNHIAIDFRMAHHTGIGRYIRGIVGALANTPSKLQYTLIQNRNNQADIPFEFSSQNTKIPIYSLSEQILFPQIARFADCFHAPHYNAPVFWKKKLVVTIHDLIHLRFANHLASPFARAYAQVLLPIVVRRADAIIAVSEHTKKDLVEMLRVNPKKIIVIHHGIDPDFLKPAKIQVSQATKNEPYFLCVGLIKAHKNIGILLEAFRNLKRTGAFPNIRLKFVGTPDLKQKVVRKWFQIIKQESDISLECHLDDQQLKQTYQNATALIFPSFYEGFGFPLLEAMGSEIPIVAARSSSIPEVIGEKAGLLFNPFSTSELQGCMRRILEEKDLSGQLVQEGAKRLQLFRWDVAAQKTKAVYESVLGKN